MNRSIIVLIVAAVGFILAFMVSEPASTTPGNIENQDCLECHTEVEEVGEENIVDPARFAGGPHTEESDVLCSSCHAGGEEHMDDPGPLEPARCDECHDDVTTEIDAGAHTIRKFKEGQPDCYSCHGSGHDIRYSTDSASPVYKLNQPETCGGCHSGEILDNYMRSVHGQRLLAGEVDGPTCSSCHGAHDNQIADIQRNVYFARDVLLRCGSCHKEEFDVFKESIHGLAFLEQGVSESATCASCHSSHQILPPSDPESTVYATKIVGDCETCHADAKLIRRFGLGPEVVRTYEESYHGRAVGFGDTQVANCASCHHYHDIYSPEDPRSSVHPDNLADTCGGCHPGAGPNFIAGKIHILSESEENFWAWLISNFYIWAIVLIIGGMIIHNSFDFVRKMIVRSRRQKDEPHVVRMTRLERILHAFLLVSFILLAYTGFALVFPNAWWVAPINWVSDSDEFRSNLHRICGVALTVIAVQHLWFLFFHQRGRRQRREFMPRLKDFRDFKDNMLFYIGVRKQRPRFGRFTYMEKAEYWALVWGTLVMIVTGFVLWFENEALQIMPLWLWEVFRVVHFYEAILAVLAIVVWHFYYVFINPDEAPMALTWLTGRMTYKELAKVHPEEYEELIQGEEGSGAEQNSQER